MTPLTIAQIRNLPAKAIIHCFTGTVMFVNEPKSGQYGPTQSLKLKDDAGDEIYIRFSKCPALRQDLKGARMTFTPGQTTTGLAGLTKGGYSKRDTGEFVHQIEATNQCRFFQGDGSSNAGFDTQSQPAPVAPGQQQAAAPAGPRMPRPIDPASVAAFFKRYLDVFQQVSLLNSEAGDPIPTEHLPQLTTHIILDLR